MINFFNFFIIYFISFFKIIGINVFRNYGTENEIVWSKNKLLISSNNIKYEEHFTLRRLFFPFFFLFFTLKRFRVLVVGNFLVKRLDVCSGCSKCRSNFVSVHLLCWVSSIPFIYVNCLCTAIYSLFTNVFIRVLISGPYSLPIFQIVSYFLLIWLYFSAKKTEVSKFQKNISSINFI